MMMTTKFEPPDSLSNNTKGNIHAKSEEQDCSPLLRPLIQTFNTNNGPSDHYNRNRQGQGNRQYNKSSIHNRLGGRNFPNPYANSGEGGNRNFQSRNDNVKDGINRNFHRNDNSGDNANRNFQNENNRGDNTQTNIGNHPPGRRYNRKRRDINDGSSGPIIPKRKWIGGGNAFYQKANNNQQTYNSAQTRLNRIRNTSIGESNEKITIKTENNTPYLNDLQDVDATDITVEVINHNALVQDNDETLTRFKMILNPQIQVNIKAIQSKRKDKQVIFPFPVTPNVTGISLHERFSVL